MLTVKISDSGKNKNKIICLVCWEPYFCTLHMFCYLSPNKASLLWTYISTGDHIAADKGWSSHNCETNCFENSAGTHVFSSFNHLKACSTTSALLLAYFQVGIVHRHFQKREWQQMWWSSRCFSAVYQWAQRGRGAKRHCWCKGGLAGFLHPFKWHPRQVVSAQTSPSLISTSTNWSVSFLKGSERLFSFVHHANEHLFTQTVNCSLTDLSIYTFNQERQTLVWANRIK